MVKEKKKETEKMNTAEMNKEQIFKFLEDHKGEKFTMKKLNEEIKHISRATIFKWVEVLIAEKRVEVEDYGNIKFVWVEK